ncbi:MAG TPA: cytochrome c oxidase subunit 3, partial [bacterium]|nr:cytochrome c oxidase subunit 3 [bacterium]
MSNATEAAEHPSYLQHHFSDAAQQQESAKLGMWIFLLTEILLFGGLFGFYTFYRAWNPEMFYNAHEHLNVVLGTVNTLVLITSSVTVALAINAIQRGMKKRTILFLAITVGLAVSFLIIKGFEYAEHFHLGQYPGKFYSYTGIAGTDPHIFFSVYYTMTGLHGLHVLAGVIVISWVLYRTSRNHFSPEY